MIPGAPVPAEVASPSRLAALEAYGILDTPPEKGFDDIVALARRVCDTSVALVSLVAGDRQWFKARAGFGPCETPLDRSVCAHTLGGPDLLVIPDLTLDARTRGNPLVTGAPFIRFYAGAPLVTAGGEIVGSLCVIDAAPRPVGLTPEQADGLRALAGQVVAQLELRRALAERDGMLAAQRATVIQHEALLAAQEAVAGSSGGLDAVLQAAVEGVMRALPHARGGVVELREGDELVYRAVAGDLVRHRGLRLPLHGSLAGACLLSGRPRRVPDIRRDPHVRPALAERLALRSCAVVPLSHGGAGIGVLKVQSSRADAFSERDLEVVSLLAGTVAAGLSRVGEAEALRSAQASEGRYKAVFDSAIDYAIVVMDRAGIVTDWNAGATRILGWERDAMCGRPVDTFFTPEDRAAGIPGQEMAAALATGRGIDERWHLRADGERFWANGEMMVLRDGAGDAVGFVKMLRDRTEQRLAAEALRVQTDLLQTITDHVGQAVFRMDRAGAVTFANPAAEAMFGWPAEALIGRNLHDVLHHSRPDGTPYPASACQFVDALHHGRTMRDREDTFFRRDGTPVRVLTTNAPVHVAGAVTSAVLTVSDVTARRAGERHQAALIELGDRLRDLTERGEIAAAAAGIAGRAADLEWAGYGRVDPEAETVSVARDWTVPGGTSLAGLHRFRDYGSYIDALQRGETVVVADVASDPRTMADRAPLASLGVRALVNIPVMERGRFVGVFFMLSSRPRDWTAAEIGFLRNVADRTRAAIARAEAETRQDLLNHELSHRMKNLMAMVQAIAGQTLRGATDIEAVRETLSQRLIALGRAHDILLGGAADTARIEVAIRGGVGLHDDGSGRVACAGPDVEICGPAALALALMLHELSTNAVKYGALSRPEGRVSIAWSLHEGGGEPGLRIVWRESGGPPVAPPARKGFGSRLIERGLTAQVGGTLSLDYPATGVTCVVEAPLRGFQRDL